jgi:hypothetical protein
VWGMPFSYPVTPVAFPFSVDNLLGECGFARDKIGTPYCPWPGSSGASDLDRFAVVHPNQDSSGLLAISTADSLVAYEVERFCADADINQLVVQETR